MCTKYSLHNCITDSVVDSLPISAADEELVLRAEKKQMVPRYEVRAKKGKVVGMKESELRIMIIQALATEYLDNEVK